MAGYLALTGGIGGAKLALGLSRVLDPGRIAFAVNTGDDFEHLGLTICPDIDTLVYTLSGLANKKLGWGREDETWAFMEALAVLGGETWFRLGDRDLALHVRRTAMLRAGATLTDATADLCASLGVRQAVLPVSNDPIRTMVRTADGPIAFQHYFVRDRCEPVVQGFEFAGAALARLNPAIEAVLDDLEGIILCPSNPFVSVDPMLAVPGFRDAIRHAGVPVVAVSPIVDGAAIKGPTAKMMRELGIPVTAARVAEHYGELIDGFVLDHADIALEQQLPMPTIVTGTVMVTLADREALARKTLEFISALS